MYYHNEEIYKPPFIIHLCSCIVMSFSFLLVVLTFPVSAWICFKMVHQYEKLVLFRLGRLQSAKGPGIVMVLPCIDKWRKVDMRTRAFNVPPQKVFTNDGAVISIGAVIHFEINDAITSVTAVQDLNHSTRLLGQTSLMNLLSSKSAQEIESEKAIYNQSLQIDLNSVTQNWGVAVTRVELTTKQIPMKLVFGNSTSPSPIQTLAAANGLGEAVAEKTQAATMSPSDILSAVKLLLNDSLVQSVGAVYKFILQGNDGGTFYLDLKNGSGDAGSGDPNEEPDAVLEMTTYDMQMMFSGELRPFQAFLSGRLKVTGDRALAMKLDQVIKGLQDSSC
uniref:Stomatin-like protein 1-like n=1 Tax=Saccoglossus kowalevskii TaxID=10224 RepID=A0ABM0LXT9_SACKO|nr:PREDICTED: stomatin-like protein 1-like [Saccoglossus kowalevskii]